MAGGACMTIRSSTSWCSRRLLPIPTRRVAAANLKRAIAVYHEVEAENLPEARLSASAERGQIAGEPLLKEEKIPVMNFGDVGFKVSYLIDFFGKLARADEAALAGAQASRAALDQARVGVVAETVRAYAGLRRHA